MISFKPEIQNKRADGTYNVRIRIIYKSQVRRLSTTIFVTDDDLTKSGKIKNPVVTEKINVLINRCRIICNEMDYSVAKMSIDEVVAMIKTKLTGGDKFRLDFIAFANAEIAQMKKRPANYIQLPSTP